MRPNVTFSPTRPLKAQGMRTEPPVSLPMPAGASRAATATPVPLDEPPGVRWVCEVPGIPRRAHQRVGAPAAEGELDHVQLAERHHAGGGQRARPCSEVSLATRFSHILEPPVPILPAMSQRSL